MVASVIDPGLTFKSFVLGAENRLAWEAARTTSESPGSAYNPLFIYSATGLGKTHLLVAIANQAKELHPGMKVVYTPLEQLLRELESREELEADFLGSEILLIDDLQFIGNHSESHQVLFNLLDHMLMAGKQVALACDRPPLELGALDDRLLSRFSGGLVVDIGRPLLETRRAILEVRLAAVGQSLRPEVVDAIARLALENVRQLKGALNRVLAAQKAEGRDVEADEIDRLLADVVGDPDMPWLDEGRAKTRGEFRDFLSDVSTAVEEALGSPAWREELARAILKWEAEGYVTKRLEDFLDVEDTVDAEKLVSNFERDIAALKALERELERLGAPKPRDLSLKDPDCVGDVRALLDRLREGRLGVAGDRRTADRGMGRWRSRVA
jgi:hypothetical protein